MGEHSVNMDAETAKTTLGGLFDRIDALVNKDGEASYEELTKVFGEHADEFLKFCDKDDDKKLTKGEFVGGILADCDGMSQEEFNTNWAERMEGVVSAAEQQSGASGGKKVLLVCTSIDKYPDGSSTGWYLPEGAHPYWKFVEAGWTVKWASIAGGVAPCDPGSVEASKEDEESMKFWNDEDLKSSTVNVTAKLEDC